MVFSCLSQNVLCDYLGSKIQKKFSVSHNENKIYNHQLYEIKFINIPKIMYQPDFIINGIHYYWMTIEEMMNDQNIYKKNSEVISFIKKYL